MKTRHFAMCFEEFVKQHGVDLIVALSLGIASHRIGIHLGDMLSDQAEGKCLRGIILFVVGGVYSPECVDRFVGFVHRLISGRLLIFLRGAFCQKQMESLCERTWSLNGHLLATSVEPKKPFGGGA